jgi:hypothetical protein
LPLIDWGRFKIGCRGCRREFPFSSSEHQRSVISCTSNAFYYDDILYLTQPQLTSSGGLLFANQNGTELLNIWGNGTATNYAFYIWQGGQYVIQDGDWGSWMGHGTFNACPIPEPCTMILLGAGLTILGIYRSRTKKA